METISIYRKKALVSFLIFFLIGLNAWAQLGSTCDNAEQLTSTGTITFDVPNGSVRYYSFTPTSDCTLEVSREDESYPLVSVFTSCETSSEIGELVSFKIYKAQLKANTKYYIQWTALTSDKFDWILKTQNTVQGELCSNPIVITQNAEFTVKNTALFSMVYYKYEAQQDGTILIEQPSYSATVNVTEGCGGSTVTTEDALGTAYTVKFQATKGKSYVLAFTSYNTADYSWKFRASTGTPGEFCTAPIEITDPTKISFTNAATTSTQYYSYTAPRDGILEIVDSIDASVSIYNDCDGSSIEESKGYRNTIVASKGQTYIIKWSNYSQTDFDWSLIVRDTIVGEYCEKPIDVIDEGSIKFPQTYQYDTRYYSYTPKNSGLLVLSDGDLYGSVAVYSGCNTSELGSDSNGDLKLDVVVNQQYIIEWKSYSAKPFTWTLTTRLPIKGEFCSNPIPITTDGDISFSLANNLKTQYYSYTPTVDGIISISDNDLFNDVYVYDACNGEAIEYSSNGELKMNVSAAKTYYIQWRSWSNTDFVWSINNRVALPGEMCDNPIAAKAGANIYEYNSQVASRYYSFTASKNGVMAITDSRRTNYVTIKTACKGETLDYNWAGELLVPITAGKQYLIIWQDDTKENFTWDITERDSLLGEFCSKPIVITSEGKQIFSDANELQVQYYQYTAVQTGLLAVWDTTRNDVAIYTDCKTSQLADKNCSDTLKIPVKKGETYIIKWRNNTSLSFAWNLVNRLIRPGELTPIIDSTSVVVNETYAPVLASFNIKTNATSVEWDFGDYSDNSTEQNPLHLYKSASVYYPSVKLTKGCFSKRVYLQSIIVKEQPSDNCKKVTVNGKLTNNICANDTLGAIKVTASGGRQPYYYIWSTTRRDSVIKNLESGWYAVTVIDADSNRCVQQFELQSTNRLALSATILDNTCNESNGSISLDVKNGKEPYKYSWSNTQNTASISDLSPDYYSVSVSDGDKCTVIGRYRISTQNMPVIDTVSTKDVSCKSTDGAIIVAVRGVAGGPYTFKWNDDDESFARRGLGIGTYTAYLTDTVSKCSTSVSISLKSKLPVTQNIALVSVSQETNKNVIVWERAQQKSEIDSYIILREDEQGTYTFAGRVSSKQLTVFKDETANPTAQAWRYRIVAADNCGHISKPGVAHRTMRIKQEVQGSAVLLTWDAYEGFDVKNFMVCRKNVDKTIDTLARKSYTATSYRDLNPRKGSKYFIAVNLMRTIDTTMLKTDTGPFSQSFSNMSEASLVDNDYLLTNGFEIYPNPASNLIHLKFASVSDKKMQLKVVDIDGKIILIKQFTDSAEQDIDISQFAAGMYEIVLETDDSIERTMMIKK